jgi:hypothetical protein
MLKFYELLFDVLLVDVLIYFLDKASISYIILKRSVVNINVLKQRDWFGVFKV